MVKDEGAVWVLVREGGSHEIWAMNGHQIQIPRHREIAERLARKIVSEAEQAAKEGAR